MGLDTPRHGAKTGSLGTIPDCKWLGESGHGRCRGRAISEKWKFSKRMKPSHRTSGMLRRAAVALMFLCASCGLVMPVLADAACASPDSAKPSGSFPVRARLSVDLDADGVPDPVSLKFAGEGCFEVRVGLSSRPGVQRYTIHTTSIGVSLFVGDIDHDGDVDLVAARSKSLQPLAAWLGNGKGEFSRLYGRSPLRSITIRYPIRQAPSGPGGKSTHVEQVSTVPPTVLPFESSAALFTPFVFDSSGREFRTHLLGTYRHRPYDLTHRGPPFSQ